MSFSKLHKIYLYIKYFIFIIFDHNSRNIINKISGDLINMNYESISRETLVANLTLLFKEFPLLDRPAASYAAGFKKVEFWWPFGANPIPSSKEIDDFTSSIDSAGVHLAHMNLFAGDMPAGERGVISHPERVEEFQKSLDAALLVARRLGTRIFNVPFGHGRDDLPSALAYETAAENLALACQMAEEVEATVLLEAVSGMPRYPIKRSQDAVGLIDRLQSERGISNLGFLFDQFHLVMNGEDVFDSVREYRRYIKHVQIADTPTRHEPGSGDFDYSAWTKTLLESGYEGDIALEYFPSDSTLSSLSSMRDNLGW